MARQFPPSSQPISDWKLDLLISPEAPKSNAVQRKPKPVSLKRSASYDSIEEIAGFKDEDVAIKRESVVKLERGHRAQIVSVVVDDEPKPKPPRKPKTPAKPTKTLAFSALPADVQPIYRTKLLTTLIEYYGGEKDPFDLDHSMDLFQTVTQHTVNKILPEKHIEIVKSGKPDNGRTYAIARQGMSEWRRGFHITANKVIKERITDSSRTIAEIKKLVAEALEDDGEAYWGEWDRNDPDASRAWCSKYILKTLAYHIQATKGSILQKNSILPLGALALSIIAVQRAFLMYESGVFVPTDEFSDENVGDLTREYAAVNLQRLMDKPSRFRALVAKASAYTTDSSSQNRRKRKAGEGVKIRANHQPGHSSLLTQSASHRSPIIHGDFRTYDTIERAWLITRLEQVEKSRYGYENPKGWIVGWPPLGLPSNGSGAIEYPSDVVQYEFACQWEVPTLAELFGAAPIYTVNNINWTVGDELGSISNLPATTHGTILPLAQTDFQANSSLSAYIIQGGNQSLMVHGSYYFLDLTGIPSAYNLTNSTTPLTTILLCDPKPSVSGGPVRLDVDNTLTVAQSGLPSTVGNIPISAANVILSSGLLGPVSEQEPQNTAKMIINYICELLFLVDPSFNLTNYPMGVPPLDIESINNNMDIFFGSASKAYTDGYDSTGSAIPTFTTVSVEAEQEEPRLAFASSKPLFIVYASFMGVATILALLLGMGVGDGERKREPFTLGTVAWAVQVRRVLDGDEKVGANAGSSTGPEYPSASYRPTYQRVSLAEESELA
ncbi:hypothetical protein JAAARDRAFT_50925 [Jaapia argillacea MUCL 33604]|uniref:Uncharacterized protein n=1 Tax=Jaapia argillacea MUCL 33604 TaxID=933084 RepID=A0A067P8T2_9AGAM|nr:hypothetical protein JAAARDRAFT_50925 [Jaapia argillacea MUCL 33604]